ncbi:MAG TPA: CDP-diacylglycerol diphosphatase [Caulobacteraceae bacterium]|jgi:CDP-diacylglycerol pyrophosphatase
MSRLFVLALCLGLAAAAAPAAAAGHSNALWHVVHDLCVTDARLTGLPAPCLAVNRRGGYAVLKDLRGRTQVLLIPTKRVTGIESPELLGKGAPNYWRMAWRSRMFFEHAVGEAVPRQDIGLAINSTFGRTQDQLHIHVDCVRRSVKAALAAHEAEIGSRWRPFPVELAGERYEARRLDGGELGGRDPFKLLAEEPAARADMGAWTLAVIGARFADGSPGFFLLAAEGGVPANPEGASEALLDHDCAVLRADAAAG